MKQLPSFADLFFLPASFDPDSTTELDTDRLGIHSVMSSQQAALQYEEHLDSYPHITCHRFEEDILVKSQQAMSETALVHWPDGSCYGVLLYEGGYFSIVSETAVVEMLAGGRGLSVIEAHHGEGPLEPLRRLFQEAQMNA